jgi:hypothetical protein
MRVELRNNKIKQKGYCLVRLSEKFSWISNPNQNKKSNEINKIFFIVKKMSRRERKNIGKLRLHSQRKLICPIMYHQFNRQYSYNQKIIRVPNPCNPYITKHHNKNEALKNYKFLVICILKIQSRKNHLWWFQSKNWLTIWITIKTR